jgi:predicted dehydrogenase
MKKTPLRWGVLGTAQIARKIWQAIRRSGNGVVAAVASRDLARSEKFIAECQAEVPFARAPRAVGSYEELITAPDLDAIYIPLPTGIRKPWVVRAADAGKHVLCEKPCGVTVAEVKEMTGACRRNKVQFMDGVMFMHTQRLQKMRAVLDDKKTVGEARRVSSAFQFNTDQNFYATNIRADSHLEPLGCLGDQGWYCIRIALWAMKWQLPERVSGRILSSVTKRRGEAPVLTEFSGELFFKNGATSDFYCSFVTALEQRVNIIGTRGYLSMNDFVLPFKGDTLAFETGSMDYHFQGCDAYMQPSPRQWKVRERSHSHATSQEVNMIRNFANRARSGRLDPFWPEVSLKTQQVMNACLQSAHAGGRLVMI